MKLTAVLALLATACAAAAPAPPAEHSLPWCVQLDRFLSEKLPETGDFSCDAVSGLALGARAEPGDEVARSIELCPSVRVREKSVGAGRVFEGHMAAPATPWIAAALRELQAAPDARITIALEDVKLRELSDLPSSFARAAESGTCAAERGAVCGASEALVRALVIARPIVRVQGGGEYRSGRLEVIAAQSAMPAVLLGDRSACRGTGGRPPTGAEWAQFREFTSQIGYAFLRSVQCQMLELSPPMLNQLCGEKPCGVMDLFTGVYRRPLAQLEDRQRVAVCAAMEAHPALSECGVNFNVPGMFACKALAPWLEKHGKLPWCTAGLSGCSDGVLAAKHAPTQIEIFVHLLAALQPDRRNCVLDRMVAKWKSYDPRAFEVAGASWGALRKRCQPEGCNFRVVSTEELPAVSERALLNAFLSHFSRPASLDVNPGCDSVWLARDDRWRVAESSAGGFGMTPAPEERLRAAALEFGEALSRR